MIYFDYRRKIGKQEVCGGVNKIFEWEWIEGMYWVGLVKLLLFDYVYK